MGIRVLVVDDDKDLLTLIEKFLVKKHPDFEVISTISAQDAIRKLEEERCDAIVCDYYLGVGEMNGLELLEWLRASNSIIPFVMFTGRSREEVAIRALNLGADLYLKKDQEDLGNLFVELVHHIKSSVESVQMEKTLREERSRFQKYLDVAGAMIGTLDSEGTVTLMNRRGCEVLGYDSKEIIGKDWFNTFIPKRLRKKTYDLFRSITKGKIEPGKYSENLVLTKDGEERIIAWRNTVLTDEAGNITGTLSSGEDITERKEAEEALRQSEQRYHDLLMTLPEGVGITDMDENFTYVNQAFSDMLGYSVEELVQKNVLDLTTANGHRKIGAETELRKRNVTSTYELQMIRKDGEPRLFEISTLPQKDNKGNVIGTIGVVSDITDRKKAEEILRESEERYRLLYENLSDALIRTDAKGFITFCNAQTAEMFQYIREEVVGIHFNELLHPDDQERFAKAFAHGLETEGSNPEGYEIRGVRKDGSFLYLHAKSRMLTKDGKPLGFQCLIHDITTLKEGEKNLKRSEEKYHSIFDNTPVGLTFQEIVVDDNGRPIDFIFIDVNEVFEALMGLKKDDIVGKSASRVLTSSGKPGLEWIDVYGKVALTGARARFDQYSEALGRWFSVTAYSPEKNFFISSYTDITERKKAYEDLKQQKKELSDFAHSMSHDLNNSFFKISASILLLGSQGEIPEIHRIKLLTKEMSDLVQHSVALADAGLVIDKKHKVNLTHLVRDVAVRHLPEGIALVQEPLLSVMADEVKLIQIFQNLFRNAVEHGSPTTVEVRRRDSMEGVRIVVANDGKPIPTESRPNIFQRGFTTKGKRRGFGLSIVKKLVEAHSWQIELVDTPETAFEILIPKNAR